MATSHLQALWNRSPNVSSASQFRTNSSTRSIISVAKFINARSLVRAETTTSSSIIQEARVALGEEPPRTSAIHSVTDQYILHTGEAKGKELPFSCGHGCCTACAEALGVSAELKEQGYALLCVAYAFSDLEVETQDEDEVYWLQFGRYFARGPVERDDYALELAMDDE